MSTGRPLALITGASSGIGAAFAAALAQRGYDLILVARRADRLDALGTELRSRHGAAVETLAADLTCDADVERVAAVLEARDGLELLVNNAGFGTKGYYYEADARQQDAMHRLHVLAAARLTRAALPGMVARRKGGIVNVASVAGFVQSPTNTSYCATKAWTISFTEGLWLELRQLGSPVKVQALCPGYTMSEFHDTAKVDRATVPKGWWMEADFVVRESLAGLERGKLVVVPALRYRLLVALIKTVPRWMVQLGAGRIRKPRHL